MTKGRIHLALCLLLLTACGGNEMATIRADGGSENPYTSDGNHDECGNGMDDDGDGQIDEGCFCGTGETQACFTGIYPQREVGACTDGVQHCVTEGSTEFGHWGPCESDTVASEEVCEGAVDEDCDGAVDESCPCTDGASQECGVEFVHAPCTGGIQTCREGAWSACEGAIGPSADLCDDGLDNDCDGETDEGCGCEPVPEICDDGVDNDCDGDIDEAACGGMTRIDGGTAEVDAGAPEIDSGTADAGAGIFNTCGSTPAPVCTERATGIVDLEGAGWPFCARHEDGRVFCWGRQAWGALGVGDETLESSATPLAVMSGTEALAAAGHAACVIVAGGQVKCWGYDSRTGTSSPETPAPAAGLSNIAKLSVSNWGFFAQNEDGTIWSWGYDSFGGLGDGERFTPYGALTQVAGIDDAIAFDTLVQTTCAVRADGSVWCWGYGSDGQAGPPGSLDGFVFKRYSPFRISGIDDAVDVQVGRYHVCALRRTGEVACWGQDGYRGDGADWTNSFTTSAAPVPGLTGVRKLEAGDYSTCAITCSGELWCWGLYSHVRTPEFATPRQITGIGPIVDVGLGHLPGRVDGRLTGDICVLEECGRVLCWGRNRYGESANGTYEPVPEPAEVLAFP